MYKVTTIGDIKLDVFIELGSDAKLACSLNKQDCQMQIKYGEKIPVDSAITMMAGSAPNIAIGLRKLKTPVGIISTLGDDNTATLAMTKLKEEGIDTSHITIEKNQQSSFSAVLNFQGESTILAVHKPLSYSLPKNLKTEWIFITEMGNKYKTLYKEIIKLKKTNKIKIAINPGAIQLEEKHATLFELLKVTDLLILNKEEAQDICNCKINNIKSLIETMKELGAKIAVITDGKNGAYASENKTIYHTPMFPGKRKEATGAGDAFATGMISALTSNESLETALIWGSVNAASVVQFIGPQKGLLTNKQIESNLKEVKNYKVAKI